MKKLFSKIFLELFKNKRGQMMFGEALRTLQKANEQPKKNKKEMASFLIRMLTKYRNELKDIKIPSSEADAIMKAQGLEATTMRQMTVGPMEDNSSEWLQAAILESFTFANTGAFGINESRQTIDSIFNWIEENEPTEFKKFKKKFNL